MTELAFAEVVRERLLPFGQVQLLYITANFEPFSSQFRPDIVFFSTREPAVSHFVELRFGRSKQLTRTTLDVLPEHRSFVAENIECQTLRFAFATDEEVEDLQASVTSRQKDNIHVFSGLTSPQDLADRILRWARASEPK